MKIKLIICLLLFPLLSMADAIGELETLLRDKPQVQEKVYLHTDNSAYFIGDTLWYKAYVLRADNLVPTNISKLLYVELLNPDGIVVERQRVVVGENGASCGQFALPDSLYSGYYEVRAYTRWQLNFNVTERDFTFNDRWKFVNKQAAEDFFRDYEGLYSRVFPVYAKPKDAGNYVDRYMQNRPKQRVLKDKNFIVASFYPEGGNLVQGLSCRMAFEVKDNHGQGLDIEGILNDRTRIKTTHEGRGVFEYCPVGASSSKASFVYNGKTYTFQLPQAQEAGASISYDAEKSVAKVSSKGIAVAAYAILCRGRLVTFQRISGTNTTEIDVKSAKCPTGVNDLIVYDSNAQPIASRLFFVNNHDIGSSISLSMTGTDGEITKTTTLKPYSPITLTAQTENPSQSTFSIAVRDAQTDERGYDDGNIMTDILLSSELKGFVASPAYYFSSDDAEHVSKLDLLLMVQGWRRYKRVDTFRYLPERMLTYEGVVHKLPSTASMLEIDDLKNVGKPAATVADKDFAASEKLMNSGDESASVDESEDVEFADSDDKMYAGRLRHPVIVEAELVHDGKVMGATSRTDKYGRFKINLPAYYDQAVLFVKAYNVADSLTKSKKGNKIDKNFADERAYPDYYVKRDMFFPIYSQPYSWYQVNSPELYFVDEEDDELIPEESRLSGNHTLQTVIVKARRRGKRRLDMTKPAIVRDAYSLYNDVTDYGLSFGVFDMRRMPLAISTYLFGNMGRSSQFNIRALLEGTSFYRNYVPNSSEYDKPMTPAYALKGLQLKRLKEIRAYTDYELRTDSGDVVETHAPDVTLDFVPIENNQGRYTYRDRRYIYDGFTYPEEFYSPDYSNAIPKKAKDYRRTLYWNPNAKCDADGKFSVTIYNNCRETRIRVSAAGIDSRGQLYYK